MHYPSLEATPIEFTDRNKRALGVDIVGGGGESFGFPSSSACGHTRRTCATYHDPGAICESRIVKPLSVYRIPMYSTSNCVRTFRGEHDLTARDTGMATVSQSSAYSTIYPIGQHVSTIAVATEKRTVLCQLLPPCQSPSTVTEDTERCQL